MMQDLTDLLNASYNLGHASSEANHSYAMIAVEGKKKRE